MCSVAQSPARNFSQVDTKAKNAELVCNLRFVEVFETSIVGCLQCKVGDTTVAVPKGCF